ncbi:hypothetical protein H0H92_009658 [Tricholoma furcatifolium]|nr:hypothetical protein H0H92_009658 [Tricholoma furcatifolium]
MLVLVICSKTKNGPPEKDSQKIEQAFRRDSPPPVDPNEPVPNLPSSQNGRARGDTMGQCSPSKPSTRIQSRPLSSTTTATNTTVTPGTPRPKKQPPPGVPVSPAMSETPRANSATRKKLHNLFGIPLSSPKKPSFSSSDHSRPSVDHAPLRNGNNGEDTDATPKPLRTHSPLPVPRPESPIPVTKQHTSHNYSAGTSASGSSRLHRLLAGQKVTLHPSTDVVSAPIIRRPSNSSHRRANSASNSTSNHSSSAHDDSTQSKHKHANPTGPSPVPQALQNRSQVEKSSSLGHSFRNNSNEFGHVGGVDGLGNLNGHMRVKTGHSHGHSHRATKHGSFDFERPGWTTAAAMQRSASGGTTGSNSTTGTSFGGWPRGNDGLNGIRESAMGPGLAGVGTLQRDVSIKRGKEREDMINLLREEESKRRAQGAKDKVTVKVSGARNGHHSPHNRSPEDSHGPGTAKASSWGRKQGNHFAKAKIPNSLGISHGPFSFEPAVSSPTWSTGSTGNGHSNGKEAHVSWAGDKGRDKARLKGDLERDKERWQDREKERRSHSANRGDRAPVPVPVPVASASMGHRSGAKGRSLDLGLGLAWASSSVRENALLPASGYFGRSPSGSSSLGSRSVGRSISGSASGHDAIEEERSVVGSQVASVFKNALDDAGYKAFKRYVDQFDAHEIPFDGPTGIVNRVERLLMSAPRLSEDRKRQMLDNFVRVVLQHV